MGIFDKIKKGAKVVGKAVTFGQKALGGGPSPPKMIWNALKMIPDLERFVGQTKKLVEQLGDKMIKSITSCRVPLSGALNGMLNTVRFDNKDVDKFFHLFMRIGLDNGSHVIYEKNERPMMSMGSGPRNDEETRNISVSPGLTLGQMIENGIKRVGANSYFVYDPFHHNCQHFQIANLSGSSQIHMTAEDHKWIDQDVREIAQTVPSWAKSSSAQVIQLFAKLSGRLV
jgi:hypothetical protein